MPTYKPIRHGVSLSQALHEAATFAPASRVMLETFELYHPIGTPSGPIYVVHNGRPINAGIESTAERNPSTTQTFMASSFSDTKPEESDKPTAPEITLNIGNVSIHMAKALRDTRGSLAQWKLVARLYASDDLSAPARIPTLACVVTSVDVTEDAIAIKASIGDPANIAVPSVTFKRKEYPGLVQ